MKHANDPIKRHDARRVLPRIEHYVHLIYFAIVALQGPYNIAAGVCFFTGVLVLMVAKGASE